MVDGQAVVEVAIRVEIDHGLDCKGRLFLLRVAERAAIAHGFERVARLVAFETKETPHALPVQPLALRQGIAPRSAPGTVHDGL